MTGITQTLGNTYLRREAFVSESTACDADSKSFCEKCAALTYQGMRASRESPEGQRHHDNWAALKKAAALGCRLCTFLTVAALHPKSKPGHAFYLDQSGPIRLKIDETWKDKVTCLHIYVPQDARPGIYYLYLIKDEPSDISGTIPRCEIKMSESERDRMSSTAINKISTWIQNCYTQHNSCRRTNGSTLPTRVLHISPDDMPEGVRLVEGKCRPEAEYVALSHCWGDMPPNSVDLLSKCDRDSISLLRSGVQLCMLPKLYEDAIKVTRAIGKNYIWIDSLCIIQDSKEDWANECEQMSDVYSNSYLTISAMSYKDNLRGFQSVCSEDVPPHCFLCPLPEHPGTHIYVRSMVDHESRNDYLKTRGWAFQELLLSPRVLHFTTTAMAFECDTCSVLERGPGSDSLFGFDRDRKRLVHKTADSPYTKYYDRWLQIVQSYSHLKLTYNTDRLPALSGIACLVASKTSDQYVAGLWKNDIAASLLWHVWPCQPSIPTYIAPTWSWASSPAVWTFEPARRQFLELEILDVQTQLSTSNPYGELSAASLIVSGPLKQCSTSQLVKKGRRFFALKGDKPTTVRFAFDTGQIECQKSGFIWCLDCTVNKILDVEMARLTKRRETFFRPHGLVLERVEEEQHLYKRIGVFEVFDFTDIHTDWHKSGFESTRIEIV